MILQTIEKGLLPADLDADISHLVPELAAQQVWTGKWLDGEAQTQPELRPRTAAITLRRLMTHSSGVAYAHLHDGLGKVRKALTGMDALTGSTLVERFNFPLLFEPGTGWRYGGGVDWAGRAVEKATGKTLEELVESGIAARLATGTSETDTNTTLTYWPEKRGILSRVAGVSLRDPATGKAVDMGAGPGMGFNSGTDECMGGAGMHASMGEYFSVLGSLFLDDGRLLTKESTRLLFENLLEAEAKAALNKEFEDPAWAVGNWGDALGLGEFGWSLGGCVADGDSHPYRRKGVTCWGGMLNLAWVSILILTSAVSPSRL